MDINMKIWLTGIVILSVAYFSFLVLTIRMMLLDMGIAQTLRAWLKKFTGSSVIHQPLEREKARTFESAKMAVKQSGEMPLLHNGRAIGEI